jgi:hypothetical protein
MSINGTNNKNFKVSTVGNDVPQNDWASQTTDPTAGMDDLFDMGADGTGAAGSDPIDGWMCGDTVGGAYVDGGSAGAQAWLDSFPPILEDVLAQNENAVNYLDMVMNRYEKAQEDLHALKNEYNAALKSATLTAAETQQILDRLPAIDLALSRCETEMEKCSTMANDLTKVYIDEQRSMKDLNNDNWIGRAFMKGSYFVQYNDDGTTTYIDPISKKPVPCPLMDPDYQAEVFSNNSVVAITDPNDQSVTRDIEDLEITDVFMKLNASKIAESGGNTFGCPIDIGIPEYFWVEREDGEPKLDVDPDHSEAKYVLFNEWDNAGGLKQKIPSDLSKHMQLKVTGVYLRSVECGTVDGEPIYRHVVEFMNDQTLICRISIEGAETMDSSLSSVTTLTDDNVNYVAASSVGVAFHDSNRASPVEFDASGFKSTARHVVPGLAGELGVHKPGDDERGDASFNENLNAFEDKNFKTKEWIDGGWEDVGHGLNGSGTYAYNGLNDRYMPDCDDAETGEGAYATFRSGVFVDGLRGKFIGSTGNDVFNCRGVNEYSDYAKEHLPDKAKEIVKDDAYYSNFVNAAGGNDVVVAGRGDNYVEEATFVWIRESGSMDENFIQLPEMPDWNPLDDNADIAPNQKTFVRVNGGKMNSIGNPHEYNLQNDENADDVPSATENDPSYLDDYYWIAGGSATFANPYDSDVENSAGSSMSSKKLDESFFANAMTDPVAAWTDELLSIPGEGDIDTDIDWEEVMGAKSDLDSEMDSFFGEMFGDFNSFVGEQQEEEVAGF